MRKEDVYNNFEVLLITDDNGIIFQLLVEKERLEELEKEIEKAVHIFYTMDEEDFKELEENGIDNVYDYLDYILEEEVGINVNTLRID